MVFFIYLIYERFKLVLWFGSYHKNVVNEAQIAAGFVFNERVDVFLFKLGSISPQNRSSVSFTILLCRKVGSVRSAL